MSETADKEMARKIAAESLRVEMSVKNMVYWCLYGDD